MPPMQQEVAKITPRDKRIVRHVQAIAEAGVDIEKFADAIRGVRDDPALTSAHREAIFKTLAQDAAQAYFVFTTGKPLDLAELLSPENAPKLPK